MSTVYDTCISHHRSSKRIHNLPRVFPTAVADKINPFRTGWGTIGVAQPLEPLIPLNTGVPTRRGELLISNDESSSRAPLSKGRMHDGAFDRPDRDPKRKFRQKAISHNQQIPHVHPGPVCQSGHVVVTWRVRQEWRPVYLNVGSTLSMKPLMPDVCCNMGPWQLSGAHYSVLLGL